MTPDIKIHPEEEPTIDYDAAQDCWTITIMLPDNRVVILGPFDSHDEAELWYVANQTPEIGQI